jgi:hypothetical protein
MLAFFEWLAATEGSIRLHESFYMYPAIESVHVWTLALFFGMAMLLDLRLVGPAFGDVPVSEVARRLLPWTVAGFIIMVLSGVLLLYAIPVRTYQSIFFRGKMVLMLIAGLNAWVFHARVWRRVADWDLAPVAPPAARAAGWLSLVLWACIIVSGRMIAYNWFDCDRQPQSAFINWAAGCVLEGE